jgi:hypothetical protein
VHAVLQLGPVGAVEQLWADPAAEQVAGLRAGQRAGCGGDEAPSPESRLRGSSALSAATLVEASCMRVLRGVDRDVGRWSYRRR